MKKKTLSFVIPAMNEGETIRPLYLGITKEVAKIGYLYQIILIDDGSTDNTYQEMVKLYKHDHHVVVVKHRGNRGKSEALQNGFSYATGDIVFTMDADLQDDPKEIANFIRKINTGYDLVSGWKKIRHDPWHKVLPSRVLNNFLIPLLTNVKIHDTNCGFKAYTKELVTSLQLYGELYRFIPVLAQKNGFRISELVITHRQRKYGKSKFNWKRNIRGLLDLVTVSFISGFGNRPGHFFGTFGLLSFTAGFIIGLYITYLRITTGSIQYRHPLLFLGMLLMIVGIQLITSGLLAEMILSFKFDNKNSNNHIQVIHKS